MEHDFHQVGADVGDLRENSAGKTKHRSAERFANRKSYETWPGVAARNEQDDAEHQQQLDRDQHHADAHTRLERDTECAIRIATQRSIGGSRIRQRIHADTKPRHKVAARHSQNAEPENNDHFQGAEVEQHGEVRQDHNRNEGPEEQEELTLVDQIGLAGLPNQLRHFQHGLMRGHFLQMEVNDQAEDHSQNAKCGAPQEQLVAIHAKKLHLRQIRQLQIGFASNLGSGLCKRCALSQQDEGSQQAGESSPTR